MSAKMITYTDSSCASELNLSLQAKEQTKMSVNISLFSDCCFSPLLLISFFIFILFSIHFKGEHIRRWSEAGSNFNKLTRNLHSHNTILNWYHSNLNIFQSTTNTNTRHTTTTVTTNTNTTRQKWLPWKQDSSHFSTYGGFSTGMCARIFGRVCPNTHIKNKIIFMDHKYSMKEWNIKNNTKPAMRTGRNVCRSESE